MGINSESDVSASLVIGPTSLGMVRIFIEGDGIDLPMDFDPEQALEIAEELRSAAERARSMGAKSGRGGKQKTPPAGGGGAKDRGRRS